MITFPQIKTAFKQLSFEEQLQLLQKIWNYSDEMKRFLDGNILNNCNPQPFIQKMRKETYVKIYERKGNPGTPDGRQINSIISQATKANLDMKYLIELEEMAFKGFIDFLHEFGGGPETFEDMACNHIEKYMKFVKSITLDRSKLREYWEKTAKYLRSRTNMNRDMIDEFFTSFTGMTVKQSYRARIPLANNSVTVLEITYVSS